MAACERINTCPMFAQFKLKSSLGVWKAHFCEGDFAHCERWKRVHSGEKVPAQLLPNGRMLEVPLERLEPKHLA